MLNAIKMPMILLFFTLLMPFGLTPSFAYGHGGGGYHGYGGGIVSSPVVETPEIIVQPSTGFRY